MEDSGRQPTRLTAPPGKRRSHASSEKPPGTKRSKRRSGNQRLRQTRAAQEGVDDMSNDKICIYCRQTDPDRFRGVEHVIPQGFGRFGSDTPTLDCVCDDCNAYFGRELDQLLTRDTYEGISRYSRGRFSSQARPQKRVSLALADPGEAGAFQGLRVSVDGTTGQLMPLAAKFHITTSRQARTRSTSLARSQA
jgi:hypothetical protein